MIKITVIALAKLKEKYLREACSEYEKRLSRYCSADIIEIDPVRLPEKPSVSEITAALNKEAEAILKRIPENTTVISLCIEGKQMSSEDFSQKISSAQNLGKGITFIIGSSYGLSEKIKQRSDLRISLSQMTFPHQLFRVMLIEQIYRSFKIIEGGTYHK